MKSNLLIKKYNGVWCLVKSNNKLIEEFPDMCLDDIISSAKERYKSSWISVCLDGCIGDYMKISEWIESCKLGCFIDYDGHGDLYNGEILVKPYFYPSQHESVSQYGNVTHILWFNK